MLHSLIVYTIHIKTVIFQIVMLIWLKHKDEA